MKRKLLIHQHLSLIFDLICFIIVYIIVGFIWSYSHLFTKKQNNLPICGNDFYCKQQKQIVTKKQTNYFCTNNSHCCFKIKNPK